MQFFTLDNSKVELFKTCLFDIVTTQYYDPSYLKHILGRIRVFFTLFGYWVGGGGSPKGLVHNLLMQFFPLDSSKMEVFKTCFFDILTTHYDHPSYLKHILGRIWVFFTLFGYWVGGGGSPKGLVHNLLMQFFPLDNSEMEVFKTCFFDIVTTQCDHPSYLKHILGRIYMFFTLFGYWFGGGLPRDRYTACLCSFSPWTAPKWKFSNLVFLIL